MDLEKKRFELSVAGRKLTIEVSRLADQANAAVLATYGETTVLATVVMGKSDRDTDFMPLVIDFEEKYYAVGKILGSQYVRREGRPSTEAILSGRIIDRAVRPLFNDRLRRDVQITATVLSYDEENDADFVALNAVSTALLISDIPWDGPIAGLALAKFGSEIVINPTVSDLRDRAAEKKFSSFIAGRNGEINMIELEGQESQEDEIIASYKEALVEIQKIIDFQKSIASAIGKPKATLVIKEADAELKKIVHDFLIENGRLDAAVYVAGKKDRESNLDAVLADLNAFLLEKGFDEKAIKEAAYIVDSETNDMVHENILSSGKRPDGRKLDEIRDLHAEVAFLPRVHGSAVFVRGNTQALAVVTLAAPGSEKVVETIEHEGKESFMLQYNFPGYSVGEAKSYRGPGRRDFGHGALAEKTVRAVMPSKDDFPYVVRVVSEIMSSNGSSSMATVCASCLALMDAGVPLKKPVAGIAMGLMTGENGKYKVLTDIQGPEDHHGDMDFKVAGTDSGVNAIQMDVKISGILPDILSEGLVQAKKARLEILGVMAKALPAPRPELPKNAPRISVIDIDPSRIGEIIGPGGKIINGIIGRTGVSIDIDDIGKVYVASKDGASMEAAIKEIKDILHEFAVGEIVEGRVVRILDFGAIVDIGGGNDGMVHVSEIKEGFVKNVSDVLNLGDFVRAKIVKIDGGKIGLSIKALAEKAPQKSE